MDHQKNKYIIVIEITKKKRRSHTRIQCERDRDRTTTQEQIVETKGQTVCIVSIKKIVNERK